MDNTTTYQITCPHCGATKLVAESNAPWNKTNAVLWSDGRIEGSDWCELARTQQCPSCKHFFVLPSKSERKEVQVHCDDTGQLPLQSLKKAITELSGNDKDAIWPREEAWQAYNAMYRDVPEEDIPVEDREFNRSNMQWLLDYSRRETPNYIFVIFELLRLLGYEDEYRKLLADMTFENFYQWKCARLKKKNIDHVPDEKISRWQHARRVREYGDALKLPIKPYIKP